MRIALLVATLLVAASPALATERAAADAPRLRLRESPVLEALAPASSRYTLRARIAPVASAGELREGAQFTLIGRMAKGAVICGAVDRIFNDGFDAP